jgi:aspartyl-tRNA(Asn)/glutamyl-tRNA(Gln) amidotransferase subunit B
MSYRSFVGLEIHIQLLTNTKVFCNCRAQFGEEPNTNVCPVCMGYPGALPALNEEAIRYGYVVAQALNCTLSPRCEFERKNYFYPDLPKNYQISQFAAPLGTDGYLDLTFHRKRKRVRIKECHLEEDAGKMIHAGDESLLDYNRAGTPLLEIVTEPDLEIGEEAETLLQEFRRFIRYLGVCDGNMEEGSMRCDANVSVNVEGAGLGTKVEIKNMNSSRFVRKALNYEIERQTDILERGGTVIQETRLWNENRDVSESMRVKESSNDYRYFPEPDLPPFETSPAFLESVAEGLVELPPQRTARLVSEHQLSEAQASFICDEKATADYFEQTVAGGADAQQVAIWLMGDVQKQLNRSGISLGESPLTPARLAELLSLLDSGRIHGKIAKQVLSAVFEEKKSPEQIITEHGWEQITDPDQIATVVDEVLAANEQAVAQIREGDSKPKGFLVGQIMKATNGRAEPKLVQSALANRLSVQFVQVLSFGGAISGSIRDDGIVVPGDPNGLLERVRTDPALPSDIRYESLDLGRFLSEEITPTDWAALIAAVSRHVSDGGANGVVVATGTDTLAYTSALLHWLFGSSSTPIVLTASSTVATEAESLENFKMAVSAAVEGNAGVSVTFGGQRFPALNLKFERVPQSSDDPVFRTWNTSGIPATQTALLRDDPGPEEIARRIEQAVSHCFVAKVFPGMQAATIRALIDSGIRYFVLELYDSGTASVRETPFSLRGALEYGTEHGALFFCTSQQEGNVDFSTYITSYELWREGAIPMGSLTTESVYGLLIAVLVTTDDWERETIARRMELAE